MKKKAIRSLALCLVLALCLALPGLAAGYERPAQELKDVGLFQGTSQGFELNRAATRVEAGVMLVRLLGMEQTAKEQFAAGKITHPFQDVPAWADAYVAWLYQNGLTKGVDAAHFGSGSCSAQMYSTFVLRALGYSEADGDFTYAGAVRKAESLGLYAKAYLSQAFVRDDVAAMSYQALNTLVKGTQTTLLRKLVDDGVVTQKAAQKLLDKQALYAEYCAASRPAEGSDALTLHAVVSTSTTTALGLTAKGSIDVDMSMILDGAGTQLSARVESSALGVAASAQEWMKDGWLYVDGGDAKYKTKVDPASFGDLAASAPLYLIDTIVKNADGSYTFTYTPALNDVLSRALSTQKDSAANAEVRLHSVTVFLKDNHLQKVRAGADLIASVQVGSKTVRITTAMDITADVTAWGDAVSITFPDGLEAYPELTGGRTA